MIHYYVIAGKTAAAAAIKNAAAMIPLYAATVIPLVLDFKFHPLLATTIPTLLTWAYQYLGASGMAGISAAIGAVIRKYKFKLSGKQAMPEVWGAAISGFIFSQAQIPFVESYLDTLPPENLALAKGMLIGLFGSLAVGVGSDFLRNYKPGQGDKE